jgi:hypothetical protein
MSLGRVVEAAADDHGAHRGRGEELIAHRPEPGRAAGHEDLERHTPNSDASRRTGARTRPPPAARSSHRDAGRSQTYLRPRLLVPVARDQARFIELPQLD